MFQLALIQTKHVIASLQKIYPKEKFEIRKFCAPVGHLQFQYCRNRVRLFYIHGYIYI